LKTEGLGEAPGFTVFVRGRGVLQGARRGVGAQRYDVALTQEARPCVRRVPCGNVKCPDG
jgi:hypothetical protein